MPQNHLLIISVEKAGDVPRVYYKGEEIQHKIAVSYDYKTKTDVFPGENKVSIEHATLGEDQRPMMHEIKVTLMDSLPLEDESNEQAGETKLQEDQQG